MRREAEGGTTGIVRPVAWRLACAVAALLYWSAAGLAVGVVAGRDPLALLRGDAPAGASLTAALLLAAAVAGYAAAARAARRRVAAR